MIVNENLINTHNGAGFIITKTSQVCHFDDSQSKPDAATITFQDGAVYHNLDTEVTCWFNDNDRCDYFTCWEGIDWENTDVLMIGIHGGFKAQYIIENKNVNSLDVVDDNQGLIDYIDYISEDITVTHTSNMLTYDVVKKYDLIIIQCYNWQDDYTDQVQNDLKTHYSTLLKDNGNIVVPIINKVL
tara:strand:- start:257 stop:814 length:558 start_codon:yes stop_codon:yes gene_type:complete